MQPYVLSAGEMSNYLAPFADERYRKPVWRFPQEIPIEGEPVEVAEAVANYSKWIRETRMQMLLLHAEPGLIMTPAVVDWCKENIRNVEIVNFAEPGGHFLQESNPDGIAANIRRWYAAKCQRGRR
jgi:haloalkane dehalogenase